VVSYETGWETRGNGTSANYDFGNVHHTGTPGTSAANPFPTQTLLRVGRVDLSGPLTNFAGPWCTVERPRLHVLAANPANHAGASRASGPVPALALYNPRTLGLEIDYAGSAPMTAGQLLVAHVWTKAVANVLAGGNVEHVRAHQETSKTAKWDPGYAPGKTIDMAAFRRAAAAITAPTTDWFDMATADDLRNVIREFLPEDYHRSWLRDVLRRVQSIHTGWGPVDAGKDAKGVSYGDYHAGLGFLDARLAAAVADIKAELRAELVPGTVELVAEPVAVVADVDYKRLATELADELDRRARDGDPATGPVS
jgi:hypothetical protein